MRQHTAPWLAAGLAALALAAGCTREEPADTAEVRQKANDAASAVGEAVNDGWITTKIQAKYFADDEVKARNIDVNTENGVVTLTGTVDNEQARKRAVEIARATDGVVRVEDRLADAVATAGGAPPVGDRTHDDEHAPAGTPATGAARTAERGTQQSGQAASNAWITTKIQAKYFADPIVKGRAVDVSTNNGVVTLTGEVENNSERQQALQLARQTEGVKRVEDRLQIVDPDAPQGETTGAAATTGAAPASDPTLGEQMSDAGITARVQSKFFLDDMVKGRNINVTTSGGTVTLEGEVRNELERDQAIALARSVDGVRDVQSRLRVNQAAGGTTARGTATGALQTADDTWITTKIQSRYFVDDLVKGADIDVTTRNGVVTLTGRVDSEEARERAEALARQTPGVSRVENRLTVGSEIATGPTTGSGFEPAPVPEPVP